MRTVRAVLSVALVLWTSPTFAAGNGAAPPAGSAAAAPTQAPPGTPATPPGAAEIDAAARALFAEGTAAHERGEDDKAYTLLSAAWKVQAQWRIAAVLSEVALKLGKLVEGATLRAYYAREAPADEKEKARALLAEAEAKTGVVIVTVDVPDAEILVDGAVSPAKPGETFYVEADVRHKIAARKGDALGEADVLPRPGRTLHVSLTLTHGPPESGPRKTLVITGLAVTGAALVAGVATGIAALGASDDAQKKLDAVRASGTPCSATAPSAACTALIDARNGQSTLSNTAIWSFVGAGVVGISTTVYALATRSNPPAPSVALAPVVGLTGGGIALSGRW